MKKKLLLLLVLSLGIMGALAGCGKNEGNNDPEGGSQTELSLPEYTYVAEYENLDLGDFYGEVTFDQDGFYYSSSIYDENGTNSQTLNFYNLDSKEVKSYSLPLEENEYLYYSKMVDDNTIILLTQSTDYESENYDTIYNLCKLDLTTGEMVRKDVTSLSEGLEYFYISTMLVDPSGNIVLSDGDNNIWLFDIDLNQIKQISINNYINAMGITKNGDISYTSYSDQGENILCVYDPATNSFDKTYVLQLMGGYYSQNSIRPGIDGDVLLYTDTGLVDYYLESGESTELVNWVNSDILTDNVRSYQMLSDGRILLLSQEWSAESVKYELIFLTKTKTSELVEKELILLKALYLDSDLKREIVLFNQKNANYRILVETYDTTDYQAAMQQYLSDILTGNGADIIVVDSSNATQLNNKGLLEDLYPYMDNDPDCNREDYFQNVLDAFSYEGKLYAMPTTVYLQTLAAKSKFVGTESGWTIDDVMTLQKSLPEDMEMMEYMTKEYMTQILLMYNLDEFINWETGECNFNSDTFINVLQFSNSLPSSEELYGNYEMETYYADEMSTKEKIEQDKLLLSNVYVADFSSFQNIDSYFNEEYTFIGYPSNSGNGTYVSNSGSAVGMNAESTHKEGVWEFIKYHVSGDALNYRWGLPVEKVKYEQMMQEEMKTDYFESEDDCYVPEESRIYNEEGKILIPKYMTGDSAGNEYYVYPPTQEEVDRVTALYEMASSSASYNYEIYNMISEEIQAYFSGEKTAEAVADIIQSRMQIYVSENY